MPDTALGPITATLTRQLDTWLQEPDEATNGLQELRERLGALKGTIGPRATSEALRALSGSEKSIRASRQRQAAEAIARACRELGIILEPKAPLKRQPRKRTARPSAPQEAGEVRAGEHEVHAAVGEGALV